MVNRGRLVSYTMLELHNIFRKCSSLCTCNSARVILQECCSSVIKRTAFELKGVPKLDLCVWFTFFRFIQYWPQLHNYIKGTLWNLLCKRKKKQTLIFVYIWQFCKVFAFHHFLCWWNHLHGPYVSSVTTLGTPTNCHICSNKNTESWRGVKWFNGP